MLDHGRLQQSDEVVQGDARRTLQEGLIVLRVERGSKDVERGGRRKGRMKERGDLFLLRDSHWNRQTGFIHRKNREGLG